MCKNILSAFKKQTFEALDAKKILRSLFFVFGWITLTSVVASAQGQRTSYFNDREMTGDNLKTVQFHRVGWPMSYPLIELNSAQQLMLSFDELGTQIKNYHFTIELCNADWSPSQLMVTEYLRGNVFTPLEDYKRSFNTTFDYVHYQLVFPTEDVSPLVSGNYLLLVFEDFDRDKPVLARRFMVSEMRVKILPDIKYPMQSSDRNSFQEIDFEVFHQGLAIQNPAEEVWVDIFQNGRTDNAVVGLPPLFFGDDRMDFNYNREVIMEGGNEFRWVDLRSLRFQSDHVKDIIFSDPFYHVTLFTDVPQGDRPYYFHRDFNGRYYIDVQEQQDPEISADYAFVHFALKWQPPVLNRHIYLIGAFTNWQTEPKNRLIYNYDREVYELTLLLKQGYYNYQFLEKGENDHSGAVMPIEGSFGQTENEYLFLVYYRGIGQRYDRLIGSTTANSVER